MDKDLQYLLFGLVAYTKMPFLFQELVSLRKTD